MALNAALSWTVFTMVTKYVMKIGGNWLLAHILAPAEFGLNAIIFTVLTGVEMLTDSGVGPSLIRSKRTDDTWLNTVWTFQILRGMFMAAIVMALAWPVANFYGEPRLGPMIMAASLITVINGMVSTSAQMAMRDLNLRNYSIVELISLLAGYVVLIPAALYLRTAWSQILSTMTIGSCMAILSYFAFAYRPHRLMLDRTAFNELFGFGIWMALTSAVSFALFQGDKLVVGKLLGVTELGVYFIALTLAGALSDAVNFTVTRVFLPAMSGVFRHDGDAQRIVALRNLLSQSLIVPMAGVSAGALAIIDFLYPAAMQGAGPVLRIMVVATWFTLQEVFYNQQFMAEGKPQRRLPAQLISLAILAASLWYFGAGLGLTGVAMLFVAVGAFRNLMMMIMSNNGRPVMTDLLNTALFLGLAWLLGQFAGLLQGRLSDFMTLIAIGILTMPPAFLIARRALSQANAIMAETKVA